MHVFCVVNLTRKWRKNGTGVGILNNVQLKDLLRKCSSNRRKSIEKKHYEKLTFKKNQIVKVDGWWLALMALCLDYVLTWYSLSFVTKNEGGRSLSMYFVTYLSQYKKIIYVFVCQGISSRKLEFWIVGMWHVWCFYFVRGGRGAGQGGNVLWFDSC